MEIIIPCDVIARLSVMLAHESDGTEECFTYFRIEKNLIIATNKKFMAIEKIWGTALDGHVYLRPLPALIEACRNEALYKSQLQINVVPQVRLSSARTTLGAIFADCINWDIAPDAKFNDWRVIVDRANAPKSAKAPVYLNLSLLEMLVQSSPSRAIVFPEIINIDHPMLVRDVSDDGWLGLFQPYTMYEKYKAAVLPHWWEDAI
jgi:hypothetical protein